MPIRNSGGISYIKVHNWPIGSLGAGIAKLIYDVMYSTVTWVAFIAGAINKTLLVLQSFNEMELTNFQDRKDSFLMCFSFQIWQKTSRIILYYA